MGSFYPAVTSAVFVLGTLAVAPLMEDMAAIDVVRAAAFVAVLMAGPALVHVAPHGSKRMLLFGSVGVTALTLWVEGDVGLDDALIGLALVLLVYLTSVHRTMRALVVPLLVLCAGALVGMAAAIAALAPLGCISEQADGLRAADWALLGASTTAAVLVFVLCLWLAGRAMELLARLVQRGWISDLTLVAAAGMVLMAVVLVLATEDARATPAVKLALFAAWVLAPAAIYAWALHRQPCPAVGRRLLMLRVFSHDRRAERMLDTIQSRWQFAGAVMEIGGPDLVKLNLDLQEFVAFATFRLHELFQPAAVPHDTLAASLDLALDREGRFRVNELFCFDTSWRGVVDQLISLADVVLLDLRGFNPQRKGTAHEVGRLAALGMLPRVVAVGDASTDWSLVEAELRRHGGDPALLQRIDAGTPDALEASMRRLVHVAESVPLASGAIVQAPASANRAASGGLHTAPVPVSDPEGPLRPPRSRA